MFCLMLLRNDMQVLVILKIIQQKNFQYIVSFLRTFFTKTVIWLKRCLEFLLTLNSFKVEYNNGVCIIMLIMLDLSLVDLLFIYSVS